MKVTVNDPLVAPSRITAKQVRAWYVETFDRPMPTADSDYVNEVIRLCADSGIDALVVLAQWSVETDTGQSVRWRINRNPAGLAVESDSDPDPATFTPAEAARVHVWALWWLVGSAAKPWTYVLPKSADAFSLRWDGKTSDQNYPHPVRTIQDLQKRYTDWTGEPQAVWAWDGIYAAQLAARANEMIRGMEVEPVAIVATECPIETFVVWDGPNRPGLVMPSPSKIVTHEVGNLSPGADEDMHRRFVLNGGGSNTVSFHFVVGPTKIVQLLYLDENAWHASDGYFGDGNRDAWGIEHIQIGDFQATLNHGAWLQAELARNPRRFAIKNPAAFVQDINPENVDERMVQHNWEAPDGKNCPQFIRERNLWAGFVQAVRASVQVSPPIEQHYASPEVPAWFASSVQQAHPSDANVDGVRWFVLRRNFEALKNAYRYARPDTRALHSGPKILTREKIVCERYFKDANKRSWIVEPDGSYVTAASFTPAVTIRSR